MATRAESALPKTSMKGPSLGKKIFSGLGFLIVCLGGLAVGTLAGIATRNPIIGKVAKSMLHPVPPKEYFRQDSINLLVLGCDEDLTMGGGKVTKLQARSDMIMVAHLDFAKNSISAVSVPRDTYCKLEGDRNGHKLNAFHAYGGNELSKRAVETLLGVDIDRVVTIDFEAFQQLVDIVGGVDVTVDKQLDYDDNAGKLHIHLKPGPQHMNGYQAMGFVRFRHSDSDLARQLRQHQFLMALKDRVMRQPQAIQEVADMGQRVLGNEFSEDEMISLAFFGRGVAKENIKLAQVPVIEKKRSAFLYLNKKQTSKLLVEMGIKSGHESAVAEKPARRGRAARNDEE